MNNIIEEYEFENGKITVCQDINAESPREFGTMVCSHKKYNLGDEQAENTHLYNSWEEWAENEIPDYNKKSTVVLPLYLYDHSGITMNTTGFHCPWDSGQVGYIYATKEDIQKEFGWKNITQKRKEEVRDILRSEVKFYSLYLSDNVYDLVVSTKKQNSNKIQDDYYNVYTDDFELEVYELAKECELGEEITNSPTLKT